MSESDQGDKPNNEQGKPKDYGPLPDDVFEEISHQEAKPESEGGGGGIKRIEEVTRDYWEDLMSDEPAIPPPANIPDFTDVIKNLPPYQPPAESQDTPGEPPAETSPTVPEEPTRE